ncbi:Qat anti-phage system TatD family nuclease QatD [Phosphitispora fastidiosa]|uniref:Qat anti-phage system TatD family nuclease QatD n=1 Tax=Phosphitispora fastidiosa TaxID=2837202 RepID=UPI001E28D8D1|nr:Qat anti-phage system TatD family nuclease QatD [Phosphitispora fastidiosa]MBU7008714.1 TatD DNase family protein [Phosphitispora fastidiosa]
MEIYDMHCHVDLMQSMHEFCKAALEERINLLAMTTTPKAFEIEKERLGNFSNVQVALGLHPQLVFNRFQELALIEKYIHTTKFVGEIGLDFNKQFYHSKERQIDVFSQIIEWCQRSPMKIISIHSVRSDKDVLDILEKYDCTKHNKCILHWYSGTLKQLDRAIDLGCFFSANEYMLNSPNGQSILQRIPVERLLLESDAPFISDIKTVEQLKRSLTYCLNNLSVIKGNEVSNCIFETSRRLLKSYR